VTKNEQIEGGEVVHAEETDDEDKQTVGLRRGSSRSLEARNSRDEM